MNKFVLEDLEDAIKKLKKMGKAVDADTVTRKDLLDLTRAKGNWELTPSEMEKVTQQTPNIHNDTTKPGVKNDTVDDNPIDLQNDTDFTDTGFDSAKTHLDDFSRTDIISRVADELVAKLSSSEYRSKPSDELKAALELELKKYFT
jgi:hypothetical protein